MDKALKELSGKFSDLLALHQELSDDYESYKETSVQKYDALSAQLDELRAELLALSRAKTRVFWGQDLPVRVSKRPLRARDPAYTGRGSPLSPSLMD